MAATAAIIFLTVTPERRRPQQTRRIYDLLIVTSLGAAGVAALLATTQIFLI